ncbi:helix-turn-helix domain-containing protein [Serratia liquefaciens]|uniref:helix-turn-helix domain-containing protein n=1 Tax=Serratia liquefaciens TaxID=614 RepID=UPI0022B94CFF|nr:helix-turn-helix domain-containing protein [Serratia liquefaciens]EMB2734806.1 helix-turn-helix domain-containing protein [Serratia marcescens]
MMNEAIQKAVSIVGSQQKLASLCGVKQPTVWRWLHGGGLDARYVKLIVNATGGQVTAVEIRPDLADLLDAS